MVILKDRVLTPLGAADIYYSGEKLLRLALSAGKSGGYFPDGCIVADGLGNAFSLRVQRELDAYFSGELRKFTLPVLPLVSPFAVRVLRALQDVPYGATVSYEGLALMSGSRACRAVGTVMRKNPIPIVIPCHRVIAKDGGIGGFSMPGGIEVKKRLLAFEREACEKGCAAF